MNHVYRKIWSRSLGMFVAVSEIAKSSGKSACAVVGGFKSSDRAAGCANGSQIRLRNIAVLTGLALTVMASGAQARLSLSLPNGAILAVSNGSGATDVAYATPNVFHNFSVNYTPSASGNNYVLFAFRQDPAYWTFGNVGLTAANSSINLLLDPTFTRGGTFSAQSSLQAPANWGIVYQSGTTPEASGTWYAPGTANAASTTNVNAGTAGSWYDGAVGSFDGIYQGINLTAGTTYTLTFTALSNNAASAPSIELGVFAGQCLSLSGAASACTPNNAGFVALATPGQTVNAGGPAATNITSPTSTAAGLAAGSLNPVFDGGTLVLDGTSLAPYSFAITGNDGSIDLAGHSGTVATPIANAAANTPGGLSVTNTGNGGTLSLSALNTYTGATTIASNAVLALTGNGSIAASSGVYDNGTLDITGANGTATLTSLSGAGVVALGGNTLALTGGTGSFGGVIGGTGGLVVNGGNQTLTGTNTYSGGTTLNGGALQVASDANLGDSTGGIGFGGGTLHTTASFASARAVTVTGDGEINTDASTTLTLTGNVSSAAGGTNSCFIKAGAGTLNLSGSATLSNGTCVEQGILRANGVVNSSFVHVEADGTLRGSGTVNAPITVLGKLAPGNSPGTLTTNSTVTMAAGSTFQADINGTGTGSGPGNYSRLLVTGASSQFIAGGASLTPNLVNITGAVTYTPYVPAVGDSFRIVSASGGVVGQFAPLAQPAGLAAGTRMLAFYSTDDIDLRIVPTSYSALARLNGADRNAQQVGRVLDKVVSGYAAGTDTAAQGALAYVASGLKANQIAALATGLAGEIHGALAAVSPLGGRSLQGSVARQLATNPGTETGLDPAEPRKDHGLWVDVTGNHDVWNGDGTASSFTGDHSQITVGADTYLDHASRVGAGFSHSTTNVSATGGFGSVEDNLLFVYGDHQYSKIVLDALAAYGHSHWDSQRSDPLGVSNTLDRNAGGNSTTISAGIRPVVEVGAAVVPFARVIWQKTNRNAFNEGSATPAALSLSDFSAEGLRVVAGVSGGSSGNPFAESHTWQYSVALGHDSGNLLHPTVNAKLAGSSTDIMTPRIGRVFIQADIDGTTRINEKTYAYYGLSTELQSARTDLGVNAGVRVSF